MLRSARRKSELRLFFVIVACATVGGGIYGLLIGSSLADKFYWAGVVQGALTGAGISAWCAGYDLLLADHPMFRRLRRAPFSIHIAAKTSYYVVGVLLNLIVWSELFAPLHGDEGWTVYSTEFLVTFGLSLLVSFVVNLLVEINRLLGQNVLANFVAGRYHRPREEERVFLFVDLIGSTRIAERIGPLRFHALLDDFFVDLSEPIQAARGQIYTYVGDEVIVTWPLEAGVARARCLTCYFDMLDYLADREEAYRRKYGVAPAFRAALHCGPVVVGEMGDQKQEIVVLGDTVNTTARLEEACRDLGEPVLMSADLRNRLDLPAAISAESLGSIALRGRQAPVEVFAPRRIQAA